MKLPIPIRETIRKRHSVRTYEERELSAGDRRALRDCMERLDNPFGIPVHKYMTDRKLREGGEKLGTYGVIKGAGTFLGISVPDEELAPTAAGYEFENLILYATSMNLGTVWLAATFNREQFAAAMKIPKEEIFPAVSPVGYPADKRSLTETLMRSAMGSSRRKKWEALFYQEDFCSPLTETEAGDYAEPLEMVRLAPSAKNMQPWRVRKAGSAYHFYVTYKQGISGGEEIIKKTDLGIALSHFHQTVLEKKMSGRFEIIPQEDIQLPENIHYVISWRMQ